MPFYLSNGSCHVPVGHRVLQIGRDADNDVQVRDHHASRHHCKLFLRDGELFLCDFGSTNGTFVNGDQVVTTTLKEGDVIVVANETFVIDSRPRGIWDRLVEINQRLRGQAARSMGASSNKVSVTGSVA